MPTDDWLPLYAERCRAALPHAAVEIAERRALISLDGRTVLVEADRDEDRVVLWLELQAPAGLSSAELAERAVRYTSAEAVSSGYVMGLNAKAFLLMLGRSVERDQVMGDGGERLVQQLVTAASAADAMLREPLSREAA